MTVFQNVAATLHCDTTICRLTKRKTEEFTTLYRVDTKERKPQSKVCEARQGSFLVRHPQWRVVGEHG